VSVKEETIIELVEEYKKARPTQLRSATEMRTGLRTTMAETWLILRGLEAKGFLRIDEQGHGYWVHRLLPIVPPR
jgi:hypothetical protein